MDGVQFSASDGFIRSFNYAVQEQCEGTLGEACSGVDPAANPKLVAELGALVNEYMEIVNAGMEMRKPKLTAVQFLDLVNRSVDGTNSKVRWIRQEDMASLLTSYHTEALKKSQQDAKYAAQGKAEGLSAFPAVEGYFHESGSLYYCPVELTDLTTPLVAPLIDLDETGLDLGDHELEFMTSAWYCAGAALSGDVDKYATDLGLQLMVKADFSADGRLTKNPFLWLFDFNDDVYGAPKAELPIILK